MQGRERERERRAGGEVWKGQGEHPAQQNKVTEARTNTAGLGDVWPRDPCHQELQVLLGEGRGECEIWDVTSGQVEGPLEIHPESLFGGWVRWPPLRSHGIAPEGREATLIPASSLSLSPL